MVKGPGFDVADDADPRRPATNVSIAQADADEGMLCTNDPVLDLRSRGK